MFNSRTVGLYLIIAPVIVFFMLHFYSTANRINITPAYQDIKGDLNLVSHSMLCINMAKVRHRPEELTLKEKKCLIDASHMHSQSAWSATISKSF